MFCSKCGTELAAPSDSFCRKCGQPQVPIGAASAEGKQISPAIVAGKQPGSKGIGRNGWLGVFVLVLFYGEVLINYVNRNPMSANSVGGTAVVAGIVFAYIWRHRGRNGWIGFAIGLVVGIVLLFLTGMVAGFIRGMN